MKRCDFCPSVRIFLKLAIIQFEKLVLKFSTCVNVWCLPMSGIN